MFRFINIDWLEVYALEDAMQYPCDAQFFRDRGWRVVERDYGTRVYRDMFTLYDTHDQPFLEVRRHPFSTDAKDGGFFPIESCHLRLHNRACYHPNAINLLREFMTRYRYTLKKIYRIDICCDFERFDKGDDPAKFIERYMQGRYSKVNQSNISAHGTDQWNGRIWNSLSWGKPKSMVSTKMYCKSLELETCHDKPYIWLSWLGDSEHRGLIDDPINHTKRDADGHIYKPAIWRVEFSIKSSANRWFVIEKETGKRGNVVMPHTLDMYDTRLKLMTIFASLQAHYFHFKHYVADRRKDRCEDKVLFSFSPNDTFYRVDRLATHKSNTRPEQRFLAVLRNYRMTHAADEVRQACDTLIDAVEHEITRNMMTDDVTSTDVLVLRRLIAERIRGSRLSLNEQTEQIRNLISLFDNEVF